MPVPTLSELFAQVPAATIVTQSLEVATDLGLPATAWQPISIGREVLYINAQIASNFSVVTQEGAAAGGFLTYASGDWLTLCAYETFDTERIESSYATGVIGLSNSTLVPYTFAAGDVRILDESNGGMTYTCTTGGTVPAGGNLATTEFTADQPGTSSNLSELDILSLVSTVPGVTPYWVENLIGQDEEGDEALRVRSREANAKASPNGPADAYDYFAKSTEREDGTNVGVTRTNKVQGNGTTTLYLADADGPLITADRDLVFDYVNANAVPSGFSLVIPDPSCSTLAVTVTVILTPNPDSSASQAEVELNITTALESYFATIPVGGDKALSFQGVYTSTLIQIIRNAGGSDVLNVAMTLPSAATTALAPNEVPTLTFSATWTT
jgi:uncharacterized phage protein gp47/JayE